MVTTRDEVVEHGPGVRLADVTWSGRRESIAGEAGLSMLGAQWALPLATALAGGADDGSSLGPGLGELG
jgi:hypothetical protein